MPTEHERSPMTVSIDDQIPDLPGFVYNDVEDAREGVEDPDDEIAISVVRVSALPKENGFRNKLPGSYHSGDKAYEVEAYIDDPDDPSVGADARWAQAKAMAAGLNAEAEAVTSGR